MEAESEAVGILAGGSGLEAKFAALEGGTVEDELAALKQGMLTGSSSSSPKALPEGRPVRDAIDMELEELRKKARE
jgi:phage shock protein A